MNPANNPYEPSKNNSLNSQQNMSYPYNFPYHGTKQCICTKKDCLFGQLMFGNIDAKSKIETNHYVCEDCRGVFMTVKFHGSEQVKCEE